MKYDFTKVKYHDLTGKEISVAKQDPKPHQILASAIYAFSYKDLPLTVKAQSIYKGEAVDLNEKEVATIKDLLVNQGPNVGLLAHVMNAIIEYINKAEEATAPTKESK